MVQLLFSSFPDSFLCRRWRNVWLEHDSGFGPRTGAHFSRSCPSKLRAVCDGAFALSMPRTSGRSRFPFPVPSLMLFGLSVLGQPRASGKGVMSWTSVFGYR